MKNLTKSKQIQFNDKLLNKISIYALIITVFFFLFIIFNHYLSQEARIVSELPNLNQINEIENKNNWELYQKYDQLKISNKKETYINKEDGIEKEMILFKFDNLTSDTLYISWSLELNYNSGCLNCNGENKELQFNKIILPNSELVGDSENRQDGLSIFVRFLNEEISKTNLENFRVKNINFL